MLIDFQQHYTPPELLKGDAGKVTVDLDRDGNPHYLLNPLLADLSAHVRVMDAAGIDAGVLSCGSGFDQPDLAICRTINDRMREAEKAHPGRFGIIKPVDPDDPGVADVVAEWKKIPGTVGIRIMFRKESGRAPEDPGFDRIAKAAAQYGFPVNVLCWGNLDAGTKLFDRHPNTRFILDHLGIMQPHAPPAPIDGRVTSSCLSPALGHPIALALLTRGSQRIGERVMVYQLGAAIPAQVVRTPFFDPEGRRVHG